jgi:hypothetical protein
LDTVVYNFIGNDIIQLSSPSACHEIFRKTFMANFFFHGLRQMAARRTISPRSAAFIVLALSFAGIAPLVAQAQKSTVPAYILEKRANPMEAKAILTKHRIEWCGTEYDFERRYPSLSPRITGNCQTMGTADTPAVRDAAIPTASAPFKVIRVVVNILANDDGSNPVATRADADAQIAQLNADYAPARIRFVLSAFYICKSTRFRNPANLTTEIDAMKTAFADPPDKNLNFYVFEAEQVNPNLLGQGTFAWDANVLTATGGFFCDNNAFGAGQKTATHEIGHCLGLWHPFHGVEEVAGCTGCRELAGRSAADGDISGDFASDTPPTNRNFDCGPPTDDPGTPENEALDSCNGQPWGTTDYSNFMGYANDTCIDHFTPQQMGRMHAWINAKLTGWLVGTDAGDPPIVTSPGPATTVGNGPVVVQFSKPMNTASTQAAFTISPNVAGTFAWSNGNQTLTYTMGALPSGTVYTVTIKGSAQSAANAALTLDGNGNEASQGTPADDYAFSFRTPGASGNDNFANATALTGNAGSMAGSNTGATKETNEPTHYSSFINALNYVTSAGNSVWYKWTTGVLGNAHIRVDSTFGPTVAVYEGSSLTTLTKIGGTGTSGGEIVWRAQPGTTYYIAVDSLSYVSNGNQQPVTTGTFTINWTLYPSPANDNFANAITLTGTTGFVNGNNMGAWNETNEQFAHGGRDSSMWYRWTAPANGAVTFDTVLGVYTGTTVGGATFLAGDNDGGTGTLSKMPFTTVANTIYTIVIGGNGSGFSSPRGDFKLNWSFASAPANDNFANAIALSPGTGGSVNGNNVGAGVQAGEPDPTIGYGVS